MLNWFLNQKNLPLRRRRSVLMGGLNGDSPVGFKKQIELEGGGLYAMSSLLAMYVELPCCNYDTTEWMMRP